MHTRCRVSSSSITVYKNLLYSLCYPCLSHTGRKQRFVPARMIRRPAALDQIVFCLDLPFILFQLFSLSLILWHMFKKVNSLYFQPAKIILLWELSIYLLSLNYIQIYSGPKKHLVASSRLKISIYLSIIYVMKLLHL